MRAFNMKKLFQKTKVCLVLMTILALTTLSACGRPDPTDAVDKFFRNTFALSERALTFISSESMTLEEIASTQTTENAEIWQNYIELFMDGIGYETLKDFYVNVSSALSKSSVALEEKTDNDENEDTTTVAVTLTTVDVANVISQFLERSGYTSINEILTDQPANKKNAINNLRARICEDDMDTVYNFDLPMVLENGEWKILINEEFFKQFLDKKIVP